MRAPSLYQYFASKHAIYDAMFAQAAQTALETMAADITTDDPRRPLLRRRAPLLRIRDERPGPRPAAVPTHDSGLRSLARGVRARGQRLELTRARLAALGITDPDATDLWTALISGLINQQLANDPGGTRWARLIDRTVDMYLADVASRTPATTKGKK